LKDKKINCIYGI